jgi:phage gpG-like protein
MGNLGVKLVGDWENATRITERMNERFDQAAEKAILQEAHYLRGKMVQNVTTGGNLAGAPFAPLSPMTLAVRQFTGRGGTKPLIVTGALRNAITVIKVNGGVFVGIKRSSKGKGGGGGANLAELHEFGGGPWTRPMTDKQRRFLAAAARNAGIHFGDPPQGGHALKIRIPARPFIQPVVDQFARGEDVKKRFWNSVARSMGGDFGSP